MMNKLRSVLLVDDDDATNFINKLLINKSNITDELITARNGKEAIEFLLIRSMEAAENGSTMPDLILLDINMPVMDGFGFLQAFQSLDFPGKESVTIAILTTSLNPKDIEKVKASGVSQFLNKPLTKTSLQSLVEKRHN